MKKVINNFLVFLGFKKEPKNESVIAETEEAANVCETDKKEPALKKTFKSRIWEIDFLRGLMILAMVLDHFMVAITLLFKEAWAASSFLNSIVQASFAYQRWGGRRYVHPLIIIIFISLAGISSSFSRSNFKRAIRLSIVAVLITFITFLATVISKQDVLITFGMIHCVSVIMLIFCGLDFALAKIFKKLKYGNHFANLILLLVGIVSIVIVRLKLVTVPDYSFWAIFFRARIRSADYWEVFPYIGYFLIAVVFGRYIYKSRKSILPKLDGKWYKPFAWISKYTIPIYLIHNIIIFVFLYLVSLCFGIIPSF